jgi:hypothetical protein
VTEEVSAALALSPLAPCGGSLPYVGAGRFMMASGVASSPVAAYFNVAYRPGGAEGKLSKPCDSRSAGGSSEHWTLDHLNGCRNHCATYARIEPSCARYVVCRDGTCWWTARLPVACWLRRSCCNHVLFPCTEHCAVNCTHFVFPVREVSAWCLYHVRPPVHVCIFRS